MRLGDARGAVCTREEDQYYCADFKKERGRRKRTVGGHGSLDSLVGLLFGLGETGSAVRALAVNNVVLRDAVKLVVLELVYSGRARRLSANHRSF